MVVLETYIFLKGRQNKKSGAEKIGKSNKLERF